MSVRQQSGYILIVLLVVIVLLGGGVAFLFTSQSLKKIQTYNKRLEQAAAEPSVVLTAEYENPFDKKTQYTNPFSTYKNPFDSF